jgi:hypothetical protein
MRLDRSKIVLIATLVIFVGIFLIFGPSYMGMVSEDLTNPQCGDGICTDPLEDEILCPEDCSRGSSLPIWLISIALIIIIAGLIYFNLYKGKKDLRELTKGKNPYSNDADYKNLKSFISKEIESGTKFKDITLKLAQKKWTKKQIEYAYDDVMWEKRKVLIDLTPGKTKDIKSLITYLNKCKHLKVDVKVVKAKLLEKGWDKKTIKLALEQVKY